jgi:hypothetical protein
MRKDMCIHHIINTYFTVSYTAGGKAKSTAVSWIKYTKSEAIGVVHCNLIEVFYFKIIYNIY